MNSAVELATKKNRGVPGFETDELKEELGTGNLSWTRTQATERSSLLLHQHAMAFAAVAQPKN